MAEQVAMEKVASGHYKAEVDGHVYEAVLDTSPIKGARGKDIPQYTWVAKMDGNEWEGKDPRHETLKAVKATISEKVAELKSNPTTTTESGAEVEEVAESEESSDEVAARRSRKGTRTKAKA